MGLPNFNAPVELFNIMCVIGAQVFNLNPENGWCCNPQASKVDPNFLFQLVSIRSTA